MKETKIEKLILNLSNRWDCSPQEAVDRLNSMNESEINKLINSMTKKFKNGGMIDCLRKGGSIKDCGCGSKINKDQEGGIVKGGNWKDYHTVINAPGDTLRFKQYFSGPTTMQTHPEGGVTYTKSSTDGISHMYGGGYKPNMWERFVLRMSPVDKETEQNWQQLIKNHKNDPAVKDKTQKNAYGGSIEKAQDGTTLTRRDAINTLRNKGFSRSQARLAYQNQKNALRNNGFSGDEMRQAARRNIVGYPTTVSRLIPASQASINTGVPQTYSPVAMSTRQEDDYMRLMTQRARAMANAEAATNFGDAFSIARNAGLQNFRWNGRDFNTRTSDEQNLIDSVLAKIAPQSKGFILPDVPAYKPYLPDVNAPVLENVVEEPLPKYVPPYVPDSNSRVDNANYLMYGDSNK